MLFIVIFVNQIQENMTSGNEISIVYPSRGRPEKCASTLDKWLARAESYPEVILSIDKDDVKRKDYAILSSQLGAYCIESKNKNIVEAANVGFGWTKGNILILISDDFDNPPKGWDTQIIEAAKGREGWIMKTDDLSDNGRIQQPWIITLPICDRKFYEEAGYIYYPEYHHMWCDTDQTHRAALMDAIIDARHIKIPHNHYMSGLNPKDEIGQKADGTWDIGAEVYCRRVRENFGLKEVVTLPKYSDIAGHISFIAANYGLNIDFKP